MSACHCHPSPPRLPGNKQGTGNLGPSSVRSVPALALSFLVAFFPKCPMCWAAYCGALGLAGISELPHFGYVLGVLVFLLGLHLLLLLRQARRVGYGPFLISIAGAVVILLVRQYAPETSWVANSGILLIVSGSLWNSFAMRRRRGSPEAEMAMVKIHN